MVTGNLFGAKTELGRSDEEAEYVQLVGCKCIFFSLL